MIPISIKLKGIYSYQNKEQFIDFQHLCDAGLFGIFGGVGSGKSTILEAISFALYGETERLNKRENRGYNMMNLKSDDLLIDFIFRNGANEKEYRFIVKGRRNSKKFEDVKTFAREAFRKEQKEWLPISADSAEEITGLSYINFRRTIIIPQGRFQEFLQLGDTDRTKMMKELFQLERFDLAGKTKVMEEKNTSQLTHLEGQLLQLAAVSKEKIAEIEEKTTLLKTEIGLNQKKLKEKEEKETKFKALKELFQKINQTKAQLDELILQKPSFEELKKKLKEFQYCQIHFKSKIEQLNSNRNKSKTLNDDLEKAKLRYENLAQQLEKLEAEYEQLKIKFNNKDLLKTEAESYEKVLKIKHLTSEADNLKNRIEKGQETLQACENSLEKLENEQKSLKENVLQLKDNEEDMSVLLKVKTWFTELNTLKNDFNDRDKQLSENNKKSEEKAEEIKKLLEKVECKAGYKDVLAVEEFYRNEQNKVETELEQINEELKHLQVKQKLSQYSENLKEGDACPVCGSTHHPDKMEASDLSALNKKLDEQLTFAKNKMTVFRESEKQFSVSMAEYLSLEALQKDLKEKQQLVIENIEKHEKSYAFEKKYTENELDLAFEKAEKEKRELTHLEKELNNIETSIGKEQKNKEKYQKGINQLETDLAAKKASSETLLQQVELNDVETALKSEEDVLRNKMAKLLGEYDEVIKNYEIADKAIKKIKPEKDNLNGIIETKLKDAENLKNEIVADEVQLNTEIQKSVYNSVDEVVEVLNQNYDLATEEEKIQAFDNKLFSINEQLENLEKQAKNQVFDQEAYSLLQAEVELLKKQLDEQNKELGSLEKDKKEHEAKLIEKEKLNKEFDSLTIRAENIKTLKNLFKGSGFVNYVSSVYLQNLINTANVRFAALTNQKLRLELTETNDFIIRDYLNEGKTRSVKTLSGGQTFQASLSLALALADNIQSTSKSANNFFFLDEGFGSLDKESLAVVFQSLKSLRKEKRVVGIISHVEELQQEIDSYLKIENNPETGSKILLSWE